MEAGFFQKTLAFQGFQKILYIKWLRKREGRIDKFVVE